MRCIQHHFRGLPGGRDLSGLASRKNQQKTAGWGRQRAATVRERVPPTAPGVPAPSRSRLVVVSAFGDWVRSRIRSRFCYEPVPRRGPRWSVTNALSPAVGHSSSLIRRAQSESCGLSRRRGLPIKGRCDALVRINAGFHRGTLALASVNVKSCKNFEIARFFWRTRSAPCAFFRGPHGGHRPPRRTTPAKNGGPCPPDRPPSRLAWGWVVCAWARGGEGLGVGGGMQGD